MNCNPQWFPSCFGIFGYAIGNRYARKTEKASWALRRDHDKLFCTSLGIDQMRMVIRVLKTCVTKCIKRSIRHHPCWCNETCRLKPTFGHDGLTVYQAFECFLIGKFPKFLAASAQQLSDSRSIRRRREILVSCMQQAVLNNFMSARFSSMKPINKCWRLT